MNRTALKKRAAGRSLTHFVTEQLRQRVTAGQLEPGDRLPTERALVDEFGVSRTVVREAIAGLRADGLVEARQGAGVFVRQPAQSPASLPLLQIGLQRISSIIEALELRAAVEIEAAELAARRSSPAQQMRIREAFEEITAAVDRGERAETLDFVFHRSIADATNNRLFRDFLEFLGTRTIPRGQIGDAGSISTEYLHQIQREHRAIVEGICASDPEAASAAMRLHLRGSQDRYRRLMQGSA